MSNDIIGNYILKVQEKTVNGQVSNDDVYKIAEEIGLADKIQTYHIVEILFKDGYITIDNENSKITITDAGYKRSRKNQAK